MNINWVFVVFIVLVLCSIKKVTNREIDTSMYTKSMSNSIKGVAALLIILHHIAWKLEETNIVIWFYREINLFAVGIFFFFSGFGLLKSYGIWGGVPRTKIIKYVSRLLLSYFLVFGVKLLLDICNNQLDYSIVKSVLTLQIPPSQLWYLKAQLICYLLFILAGKLCKQNYFNMILCVLFPIMLWICVSIILGRNYINMTWYNTLPCFPMGMLFAAKEEKINKVIKEKPIKTVLILTMFLFCLSIGFLFIAKDIIYLMASVYSVLIYLVLSNYWAVCSKLWEFIGKHSLSIYLIHLQIINLFIRDQLEITDGIFICCMLFGTLILAVFLDAVVDKTIKKLMAFTGAS